MRIVSQKNLVT